MKPVALGALSLLLFVSLSCQSSDPAITAAVKAKLAADPTVQALEIDVDTRDGVVTLTANLDNEAAKDRAIEIARETVGVVRVEDMISVRTAAGVGDAPSPDRTVGTTIDDAALTARVKSRLVADPLVKGSGIDVDTRNGVVFLTGTVSSPKERDHAIELARTTEHVVEVSANLTVSGG